MSIFRRKKDVCPKCRGKMVPIKYGFPGPEMIEQAERGEIVIGGCMVNPNRLSTCIRCDEALSLAERLLKELDIDDHEPDNERGVWCCQKHRTEFMRRNFE